MSEELKNSQNENINVFIQKGYEQFLLIKNLKETFDKNEKIIKEISVELESSKKISEYESYNANSLRSQLEEKEKIIKEMSLELESFKKSSLHIESLTAELEEKKKTISDLENRISEKNSLNLNHKLFDLVKSAKDVKEVFAQ